MLKEKWFWILGWALFLLSLVVIVFTNIDRYGFHSKVTVEFVISRSLETILLLFLMLSVLVLTKSLVSKVWLRKYRLGFWSLFKIFLSITLFDLFFCVILIWCLIRVFFWKSWFYIFGLSLYFIFEFLLSRKFLMKLNKEIKNGFKWNLNILGMIVVSNLLFVLILMKL